MQAGERGFNSHQVHQILTERSSVWLERPAWDRKVGSSNLSTPTTYRQVAQRRLQAAVTRSHGNALVRVQPCRPYGFLAPMVEQRPVKAMVAGSSPAEAATFAPLSQSGRGDGFRIHKVQVRVLCGAPAYLVRLKQRTRSYGLRNVGWIPTRDTMIFSSNGRIPDF